MDIVRQSHDSALDQMLRTILAVIDDGDLCTIATVFFEQGWLARGRALGLTDAEPSQPPRPALTLVPSPASD